MDTNNGSTIYRESSQSSEEQQHQYNSNKTGSGQGYPSSGNKSNKTMIIMLAVIVVLLAAIAAILLFKNSGEKEEPQKDEVVKKAKKAKQKPTDRTITVNGVSFKMVYVKGGTFQMGTSGGEFPRESPAHSVTVSDFYIGETEVTQELWEAVMEYNPSSFSGSRLPVENIDYNDCQEFIEKLNELTGEAFRLPFEAEWEFASRGGTKSEGYNYSGSNAIGDVAWYNANSGSQSHEVGTKKANELGIFDMSGNVWEWCEDFFDDNYYSVSPEQDPTGPDNGNTWLNRGGSWKSGAKYCRSAYRGQGKTGERESYLGMRLAIGTKTKATKSKSAPTPSIEYMTGIITDPVDDYVNVRKGPGTNYEVVTTLDVGDEVYYTSGSGNWMKVYDLGENYLGYVYYDRIISGGNKDISNSLSQNAIEEDSNEQNSNTSEDWNAVLDAYEKYVDQYIRMMERVNKGDDTAIAEYPGLLAKAEELQKKLENAKGEMTSTQIARLNKIQQKMLDAAQAMQ